MFLTHVFSSLHGNLFHVNNTFLRNGKMKTFLSFMSCISFHSSYSYEMKILQHIRVQSTKVVYRSDLIDARMCYSHFDVRAYKWSQWESCARLQSSRMESATIIFSLRFIWKHAIILHVVFALFRAFCVYADIEKW